MESLRKKEEISKLPELLREIPEKTIAALEPCIRCDVPMIPIRGSKKAICANCGYKNDCC